MLVSTEEVARRLGRSIAAITKAARQGRFGSTVHRGDRGQYLFAWPEAETAFRDHTDPTRFAPVDVAELAPEVNPHADADDAQIAEDLADLQAKVLTGGDLDAVDRLGILAIFRVAAMAWLSTDPAIAELAEAAS